MEGRAETALDHDPGKAGVVDMLKRGDVASKCGASQLHSAEHGSDPHTVRQDAGGNMYCGGRSIRFVVNAKCETPT